METQRGLLLLLGFALFLATVHATDDKNADQMPLLKSLYKSRSPALLPAALRADNETISPACSAELKRLFSGDIHTLGTDAVMGENKLFIVAQLELVIFLFENNLLTCPMQILMISCIEKSF